MEIEFALTAADLIALARHQLERSPGSLQRLRRRRWAYAGGFLLLAVSDYVLYHDRVIPAILALLAVLFFVLFPVYARWLINWRLPRLVRERTTPATLARRTLRLTPEGLEQVTSSGVSRVSWPAVDRVDTSPERAFISIEGTYSLVIPQDPLDPQVYAEFIAGLQAYCRPAPAPAG